MDYKIEDVFTEWNPWWSEKWKISFIERREINTILPWIQRKEILCFLGVRRCGKTTMMHIIINKLINDGVDSKNILFIKSDDDRVKKENLINNTIEKYKELLNPKGKIYLFIDEVQDVDNSESILKRIYDLEKNTKIFISGSNSSLLKNDVMSKLAGRIAYFEIYPFDFKELLKTRITINNKLSIITQKDKIKHNLIDFLESGGFPEVVLEKNTELKKELLGFYYDSIMYRDIIKRKKIRNVNKMESLIKFYLQNISNLVNFTRLGKTIGLSTDSVIEYTQQANDAYLIFTMPLFSHSIRAQEINPKKIYCVDTGLRNIAGFRFSEDIGRLYENIVFLTLKRNKKEIYYWKDKKQREVDFIVKKGKNISEIIQVCNNINNADTKKRELDALCSAMDEFGLNEGLIITENVDTTEHIDKKTIRFIPLWKWLCDI